MRGFNDNGAHPSFECAPCGKSFAQKVNLGKHEKTKAYLRATAAAAIALQAPTLDAGVSALDIATAGHDLEIGALVQVDDIAQATVYSESEDGSALTSGLE